MHDEFPKALEAFREAGSSGGGCPLEPQFTQLFRVLGDRDAQDAIRDKHANVNHCPMLRNDPSACIGCENNPFEIQDDEAAVTEFLPIIDEAYRLHDLAELGFISELGVVETELVRIVHQAILIDRMKVQASLIAHSVAQCLMGKPK